MEFAEYVISTMGGGFGECDKCQKDALEAIRPRLINTAPVSTQIRPKKDCFGKYQGVGDDRCFQCRDWGYCADVTEHCRKAASDATALENPCIENGCTDIENCDEVCQNSRIYTPLQMQQAKKEATAAERERVLDALQVWLKGDAHSVIELDGCYICIYGSVPEEEGEHSLWEEIESLRSQP